MSIIKTKGIVIAENNLNDYDKMLTLLTPGLRKNFLPCKRGKKNKEFIACRNPIFMFWRIHAL